MIDQAATLRQLANNTKKEQEPQIISIVSGKLGEGDLNITVKLGAVLAKKGKKVLIILEVMEKALLKSQPFTDILNCHKSKINLKDYIIDGPFGIKILQGVSDSNDISSMDENQKHVMLEKLRNIGDFNYILIYAGAGTSQLTISYINLSNLVYVLTNPQISYITDAYSLIKAVNNLKIKDKVKLIVYKVQDIQEGNNTYNNIKNVGKRFLDIRIEYSGAILGNPFIEVEESNLDSLLDEASITSVSEDIQRIAGELLTFYMD